MFTEIDFKELNFTLEEVARVMGYGTEIPEDIINENVERMLAIAAEKATPSCYYSIVEVELLDRGLRIGDVVFETDKIIARLMKGADKVAMFLATAGMGFENWVHELKEQGDYLDMYIADSLGTCIVEQAGDYMERLLEKELGTLKHTNRFSPGYCGWHVSEQKKFFSFLPPGICGVTLRESCLMTPIKSISGIIGIGPDVKAKTYSCNVCELEYCYLRQTKPRKKIA